MAGNLGEAVQSEAPVKSAWSPTFRIYMKARSQKWDVQMKVLLPRFCTWLGLGVISVVIFEAAVASNSSLNYLWRWTEDFSRSECEMVRHIYCDWRRYVGLAATWFSGCIEGTGYNFLLFLKTDKASTRRVRALPHTICECSNWTAALNRSPCVNFLSGIALWFSIPQDKSLGSCQSRRICLYDMPSSISGSVIVSSHVWVYESEASHIVLPLGCCGSGCEVMNPSKVLDANGDWDVTSVIPSTIYTGVLIRLEICLVLRWSIH